ncbi:rhodanese-like domain-containing protein [Polaribacter sp. WD7]|uniref:rhodanese-like domain-containing protein n=1 Tax=Polaribacter sp. WD7 TaxID=2269061 RepID=UPI0015F0140F|nr:rhodanese-like domain-containing protein [Polaribacter sp. WD7]
MKLKSTFSKNKITKFFKIQTYVNAACIGQNADWQISPKELKAKLGEKNLEIIAVLANLKLPFKVQKTIPINQFNAKKIEVDFNKTYVMVCQRGVNSYRAVSKLKKEYPALKVLNLTGGISSYKH